MCRIIAIPALRRAPEEHPDLTYRVIVQGTGFVGKMVIRELAVHPDFEIVGEHIDDPPGVIGPALGLPALPDAQGNAVRFVDLLDRFVEGEEVVLVDVGVARPRGDVRLDDVTDAVDVEQLRSGIGIDAPEVHASADARGGEAPAQAAVPR